MIDPGSIVMVHLASPNEKYWGVLESLSAAGVTLRCIHLSSFEDWIRSIAYDDEPSLGLGTIFFPMMRIERIFLDEQVGQVESLSQRFERQVGATVEEFLGLGSGSQEQAN